MKKSWRIGLVENEQKYRDYVQKKIEEDPDVDSFVSWNSAEEYWRDKNGENLDLIFIDVMLSHMNGVELTGMLTKRNPEIAKIILTNMDSEEMIFEALKNGAVGYVLKSELDDILSVMRIVMGGGAIITPTIALHVLNSFSKAPDNDHPKLTDREKQTLELLVRGLTKKKAADRMGVSENTLSTYTKSIYKKLNVSSRLELFKKSEDMGLL